MEQIEQIGIKIEDLLIGEPFHYYSTNYPHGIVRTEDRSFDPELTETILEFNPNYVWNRDIVYFSQGSIFSGSIIVNKGLIGNQPRDPNVNPIVHQHDIRRNIPNFPSFVGVCLTCGLKGDYTKFGEHPCKHTSAEDNFFKIDKVYFYQDGGWHGTHIVVKLSERFVWWAHYPFSKGYRIMKSTRKDFQAQHQCVNIVYNRDNWHGDEHKFIGKIIEF